ncbi:uncharacterized protein I206_101354 [Kwoniella pini CBS 10737]|uniref:Uncharacterized protein n=1 Tax=Kwoniella pini CBS 10737 TaxID=1296096 RepID=A0A1B9HWX9_9TREE|nr:uncharacterized protein I206_06678 [Kwoniella pini CBS 10737]OCF47771.1 hypothetical protein I206_06678 [Kwoniella pini CBS 10737]
MPSSSPLPRPKSSPSLPAPNSRPQPQFRAKKEHLPLTPLSPAAAANLSMQFPSPHPLMVALAGWPETIYVSNNRRHSLDTSNSHMGFESLSSGQVYDGVPAPALHSHKKMKSRPTTPPKLESTITSKSPEITDSPFSSSSSSSIPTSTFDDDKDTLTDKTPLSIRNKLKARAAGKTKANPVPNIVPKPISAPNLSIFAPVCPHLTDPSLGPCPFKSHPHDVRNMFPPTSHLSSESNGTNPSSSSRLSPPTINTSLSPILKSSSLSPTSESGYVNNPLSSPEYEKQLNFEEKVGLGERKNPEGLTNYFPVPGIGAPKPRTLSKSSINAKPSSSNSSVTELNTNGKRKESPIDDTSPSSTTTTTTEMLHKGRSLPSVPIPSWNTSPKSSNTSPRSTSTSPKSSSTFKGKGKQSESDLMDIDINEEDYLNSSPILDEGQNGVMLKVEM